MVGRSLLFVVLILLLSSQCSCQVARQASTFPETYCFLPIGERNDSTFRVYPDSEMSGSVSNIADQTLLVSIVNRSSDTLYLFNSYLSESYQSASCLHRINLEESRYVLSFLPLHPYLGVRQSDTKIISPEKVCHQYQVQYDFIVLHPDTHFDFAIDLEIVAQRVAGRNYIYEDLDVSTTSKFDAGIAFRTLDKGTLSKCLDVELDFAIYTDIGLLCDKQSFYLDEITFDERSKSYTTLSLNAGTVLLDKVLKH